MYLVCIPVIQPIHLIYLQIRFGELLGSVATSNDKKVSFRLESNTLIDIIAFMVDGLNC